MTRCADPSNSRRAWKMIPLTVLASLVGCSALKVDVDVYKGPLTSQRELQLRQFSALAIAAKPLLAELRNAAELAHNSKFQIKDSQKDRRWSYIEYAFEDDVAKFANGALSYYDDLEPAGGLARTYAAESGNLRFQDALQRFAVSDLDCKLADRLPNEKVAGSKLQLAVARFLRAGTMKAGDEDLSVKCANGERDLNYATSSAALGRRQIEGIWNACQAEANCPFPRSVSEAYLAFADPKSGTAKTVAALSLPKDPESARAIERRLVDIGKAFEEAREAMVGLWQTSDALFEEAYRVLPKARAQRTAAFIANTTEPRILACFLHSELGLEPGIDSKVRTRVRHEIPTDWGPSYDRKLRASRFVRSVKALEDIAHTYPEETRTTLEYVDKRLKGLSDEDLAKVKLCPQYRVASDSKAELSFASKRYGLARGTAVENEFDAILDNIVHGLASLTNPARYGFDEGRGRAGIVTLTQEYIELLSRTQTAQVKSDVIESRRKLEETLIPFAERVLFVANNAPLLNRQTRDAAVVRNAALLQAVGNTIIVLVDDIRRQDDHDKKVQSRRFSEALAINRAFAGQPGATYDALIVEIASTARRLQADAVRLKAEGGKAGARGQQASAQAIMDAESLNAAKTDYETKKGALEAAIAEALRYRAATATLVAPRSSKGADGKADDFKASDDRKSVAARIGAMPADSRPDAVVASIKAWIDEQIEVDKPSGVVDDRGRRLAKAKEFFGRTEVKFPNLPEGGPAAAFNAVKLRVSDWLAKQEGGIRALKDDVHTAEETFRRVKEEVAKRTGVADVALAESRTLEEASALANTSAGDLNAALQAIKDVRETVLAKASGPDASNPTALMQNLAAELRDKATAAAAGSSDAKRFGLAAAYVSKTSPAALLAVEAEGTGRSPRLGASRERTQIDVIDDLIAQLRQQRLQAIANGDPSRAKNYEDAIKAAFDQRGSLGYLRPASSYLRNVYAATAIQADPDDDANMLTARWSRQSRPEEELARASVEKQFWQNINTVSVDGAGAANYVLVKDDIGNWYLKALASDTNSIIQSAQSLALFNLGKKFDVNLLRRAELQRRVDSADTSDDVRIRAQTELEGIKREPGGGTKAATSDLSTVQRRYADDYATKTATDVESLLSSVMTVGKGLEEAWKRDVKGDQAAAMQPILIALVSGESDEQKVARQQLEAVGGKPESDRPVAGADAVIEALRAMRRMRDRVSAEVIRSDTLVATQKTSLEKAQELHDGALKEQLALKADADAADVQAAKDKAARTAEDLTKAQVALTAAKDSRATAGRTVVTFFNELMSAAISSRLDTVKVADTAYSFIGEAAGGK